MVMKPSAVSNRGYTTVVPARTTGGSTPASRVGCMLASCQVLRWMAASSTEKSRCWPRPVRSLATSPMATASAPTTPAAS